MKKSPIEQYNKIYADIDFERSGLFNLMHRMYGCSYVIYPGCSIHITPSFYFQHVVYVDVSEAARAFFSDNQEIQQFINKNKKYKQSPYIRYLDLDYTMPLPLREGEYDLLISLYAPGVSKYCQKYIKPGGKILSNNYHDDLKEAMENTSVVLSAIIRRKGKVYEMIKGGEYNLDKYLQVNNKAQNNTRDWNKGMKYIDHEIYFVMEINR